VKKYTPAGSLPLLSIVESLLPRVGREAPTRSLIPSPARACLFLLPREHRHSINHHTVRRQAYGRSSGTPLPFPLSSRCAYPSTYVSELPVAETVAKGRHRRCDLRGVSPPSGPLLRKLKPLPDERCTHAPPPLPALQIEQHVVCCLVTILCCRIYHQRRRIELARR
jgi:hypothetical protein